MKPDPADIPTWQKVVAYICILGLLALLMYGCKTTYQPPGEDLWTIPFQP